MDVSPGLFLIRSRRTSSISTQFAGEPKRDPVSASKRDPFHYALRERLMFG